MFFIPSSWTVSRRFLIETKKYQFPRLGTVDFIYFIRTIYVVSLRERFCASHRIIYVYTRIEKEMCFSKFEIFGAKT